MVLVDFQYDVFLSHNSKDKGRVRALAEKLKGAGLKVWFDEWEIKPGDIIALKVDEGLEQSRMLLLCVSPNALESGWVALERSTAIHRDPANEGRRFVPLLIAECKLPDTLRRYRYVDYREESEAAFAEIFGVCRGEGTAAEVAETPKMEEKKPTFFNRVLRRKGSEKTALRSETPKKQTEAAKGTEPLAVYERKLEGHQGWVHCVAVSPDATWAASGSHDKTVKVWDLETGECRETLKEHNRHLRSVAITSERQSILFACIDGSVRIWERHSEELEKLEGHTNDARSVVVLKGSARAISGGWDGTLKLWNLDTRTCIKTIEYGTADADPIFCCAANRAGTQALSGHQNGQVRLWSLASGNCLATLRGHSSAVTSVTVTTDGRFGVSGSLDKTVKIWDLEAQVCIATLEGHRGQVLSVALSPDDTLIASAGLIDHMVRLWDFKSGECLEAIEIDESPLCVVFSPTNSRLVVGTAQRMIFVYRLTGAPRVPVEPGRGYRNAKVVLLGEGTVGKTSLAYRLVEDKYVVKDRTHGMNVWPLELPLAADDSMEREALLWDLAGQEDYRLIHQLFLDEVALAMLLVNPQRDDPFVEAGDWLKALKTAANQQDAKREAARLLVFSQIDVGGMKLGDAKISQFREKHGFADWLPTSAKTGENCSDGGNGGKPSKLKELIAKSIPWEKLPWTSTPRLLAELKKAVMTMRSEADIRLLRFAELAQRLERALPNEKFGEADVRTAVTLLANHGLARALKFGDLVLLQPELLNGYAGAIIRSARANKDEIGSVLEANIYRKDFDFTGVERLKNRPDEELLLRAMVQTFLDHSLCIAEDTRDGRHLVFPSQYRREKESPKDPDIFVSYTFSGEWQSVWTTLIVRLWYSQEFEHRELWRNAAEFASPKGHVLGLKIDNQQGEGTATIGLYFDHEVPDDLKAIFIEYVHRHLAKFGCEVSRDRRYICRCGRPFKDLDLIRDLLADGAKTIICQKCRAEVELIDFIEQRLKSDPVAQKIMAMDAVATRGLDAQALEQILIGHMMAIAGEANQIFRPATMFDHGIDGEVEFKDNDGKASGKRIYIQLKSGNSYLRTRKGDGTEVFDVKDERHLEYWVNQPVDVYLVIRQTDEARGGQVIRWMNVTRYLKQRKDKESRQIVFSGEKLDMNAVYKVRDEYFPLPRVRAGAKAAR